MLAAQLGSENGRESGVGAYCLHFGESSRAAAVAPGNEAQSLGGLGLGYVRRYPARVHAARFAAPSDAESDGKAGGGLVRGRASGKKLAQGDKAQAKCNSAFFHTEQFCSP